MPHFPYFYSFLPPYKTFAGANIYKQRLNLLPPLPSAARGIEKLRGGGEHAEDRRLRQRKQDRWRSVKFINGTDCLPTNSKGWGG